MSKEVQARRWGMVEEVIRLKAPRRFVSERQDCFFDTCFYPIVDDSNQVTHITIYAQEITKQKKAQDALQATEGASPRQLQIQGTLENRQLQLQFSDTCGGIPPDHEPKIFEPFFTSKSPEKNTGLGLCVAQRMVEDRGGRIQFENRPGEGVTFFLTIPLDDEA